MENEIMNIEEINNEELVEQCEPETSGDGLLGKLVIGLAIVGVGLGALAFKSRDRIKEKITARRIRKLEKQGYVVYDPEDVEYSAEDDQDLTVVSE